jgi:hypothetical protein
MSRFGELLGKGAPAAPAPVAKPAPKAAPKAKAPAKKEEVSED